MVVNLQTSNPGIELSAKKIIKIAGEYYGDEPIVTYI